MIELTLIISLAALLLSLQNTIQVRRFNEWQKEQKVKESIENCRTDLIISLDIRDQDPNYRFSIINSGQSNASNVDLDIKFPEGEGVAPIASDIEGLFPCGNLPSGQEIGFRVILTNTSLKFPCKLSWTDETGEERTKSCVVIAS